MLEKPTVLDEKSEPLNDSAVVGNCISTHSIENHVQVTWWFADCCEDLSKKISLMNLDEKDSIEYTVYWIQNILLKNCKLTYASSSGDRSPSPSTSNNRYALSFAWQLPTVVSRANNRTWTLCGTKLFFRTVLDANARAVLWKKVFIFFKFSFVSRGKKRNDVDLILNETRAGVAPNSLHDLGL